MSIVNRVKTRYVDGVMSMCGSSLLNPFTVISQVDHYYPDTDNTDAGVC